MADINTPALPGTALLKGFCDIFDRVEEAPAEMPGETRTQTRVTPIAPAAPMPSQGVPRPGALTGQPRAPMADSRGPIVRRPVQADGYEPLPQLGGAQPVRSMRREEMDMPRRPQRQDPRDMMYPNEEEYEEEGRGRGLIFVIAALLIVAALVIGLILIPEEDETFLGDAKRMVTEPLKKLFSAGEQDEQRTASASSFTGTVVQETAPYKVLFTMVTSSGVTAVRVVDEAGAVIPTVTTLSIPNAEDTIVWQFEMSLDAAFDGTVQGQLQAGEAWQDTGLTQTLRVGLPAENTLPAVSASLMTKQPASQPTITMAPTATPTKAPTPTPEMATDSNVSDPFALAVASADPTDEPMATPGPTQLVTATPTLSVTATPTLVPTATPTADPTAEPTAEPTPEPTAGAALGPVPSAVLPRPDGMGRTRHSDRNPLRQASHRRHRGLSLHDRSRGRRDRPMAPPGASSPGGHSEPERIKEDCLLTLLTSQTQKETAPSVSSQVRPRSVPFWPRLFCTSMLRPRLKRPPRPRTRSRRPRFRKTGSE